MQGSSVLRGATFDDTRAQMPRYMTVVASILLSDSEYKRFGGSVPAMKRTVEVSRLSSFSAIFKMRATLIASRV